MKRTFNTKRTKVRGMFPYIVRYTDNLNKDIYMFEVTRKTSFRQILKMDKTFADEEIIFATTDPLFAYYGSTRDAANLYELEGQRQRKFYFIENHIFYKVSFYRDGNGEFARPFTHLNVIDRTIRMTI